MNIHEAAKLVRGKYKDKVINECLELSNFYAFSLVEKGRENELCGGGYHTVDKTTGELSVVNPIRNLKVFMEAKKIDIANL